MEGKKRCKGFVIRRNALCRYEKRQRYNFKNPIWVNSVSSVPLKMIQFRSGCENESSHEIKNEAATPITAANTSTYSEYTTYHIEGREQIFKFLLPYTLTSTH